jgi:hypothetical protein
VLVPSPVESTIRSPVVQSPVSSPILTPVGSPCASPVTSALLNVPLLDTPQQPSLLSTLDPLPESQPSPTPCPTNVSKSVGQPATLPHSSADSVDSSTHASPAFSPPFPPILTHSTDSSDNPSPNASSVKQAVQGGPAPPLSVDSLESEKPSQSVTAVGDKEQALFSKNRPSDSDGAEPSTTKKKRTAGGKLPDGAESPITKKKRMMGTKPPVTSSSSAIHSSQVSTRSGRTSMGPGLNGGELVANKKSGRAGQAAAKKQQNIARQEAGTTPKVTPKKRSRPDAGEAASAKRSKSSTQVSVASASAAPARAHPSPRAPPATLPCSLEAPLPQDAPKWFVNAVVMARSVSWGGTWVTLLESWLKYQRRSDLGDDGKLRTAGRPACIAAWIARARSPTWRPQINDVAQFEKEFWSWWNGLQPEWRESTESNDGDWGDLRKPGANGIVSVVAALFYWGTTLGDHREDSLGWSRAVEDVDWVLQQL